MLRPRLLFARASLGICSCLCAGVDGAMSLEDDANTGNVAMTLEEIAFFHCFKDVRRFVFCCCKEITTEILQHRDCVARHEGCCDKLAWACPEQQQGDAGEADDGFTLFNQVLNFSQPWKSLANEVHTPVAEPYRPEEVPALCAAVRRMYSLVPSGEVPISQMVARMWLPSRADGTDPTRFYPSKSQIRLDLYVGVDPYEGLTVSEERRQTFGGSPSNAFEYGGKIRQKVLGQLQGGTPKLMVEVGSFMGSGVIGSWGRMAMEFNGVVICVDTWQGDVSMRLLYSYGPLMNLSHGYPQLQRIFMEHMVSAGLQDRVFPLAATSISAARMLFVLGYRVDVIYIDSSHERGETIAELHLYWQLLRLGGLLMGDDYSYAAVRGDLLLFVECHNVSVHPFDGGQWFIHKPIL